MCRSKGGFAPFSCAFFFSLHSHIFISFAQNKGGANIASPHHSRVLFHLLIILSVVLKNTYILHRDDIFTEKDARPLLFALWAVSDSAINSGFAAKLIFLQK